MNKINVAVIGCGNVSWHYHFPGLQKAPNLSVKAIVDTNLERATQIKSSFLSSSDVIVTDDYHAVLDNKQINAIIIATPPYLHYKMALDAIGKGKNVFCEKPFVLTVDEAFSIVESLKNSNLKFMVGFNYRFIPHFSKMFELVRRGAIGKPLLAKSAFFSSSLTTSTFTGFHLVSAQGGGALFEMGCHHIDLLLWMFGKVKAVYARILNSNSAFSVDDTAYTNLEFENGTQASFDVSWAMSPRHKVEIFGTEGAIVSDLSKGYVELYAEGKSLFRQGCIQFPVKDPMDSYGIEFREFGNSIIYNRQPTISAVDGLESLKVIKACYESSRIGERVTLT